MTVFDNDTFCLSGLFGLTSLGAAVGVAPRPVVCYVAGARILTDKGYVAVEDLQAGDVAVTATGALEPIRWIGRRRIDLSVHKPELSQPVCIRAHAFGENQPQRDLRVSPRHAVAVDGFVLSAYFLINGATVIQEALDSVEYFHVECDRHVLLMAENTPGESYRDQGDRSFFANADTVSIRPEMPTSTPVDLGLPLSHRRTTLAIRRRLRERAEALGYAAEQFVEPAWAA